MHFVSQANQNFVGLQEMLNVITDHASTALSKFHGGAISKTVLFVGCILRAFYDDSILLLIL